MSKWRELFLYVKTAKCNEFNVTIYTSKNNNYSTSSNVVSKRDLLGGICKYRFDMNVDFINKKSAFITCFENEETFYLDIARC